MRVRGLLPHRPRSWRGWLIAIAAAGMVLAAAGVALVYLVAFGTSSPPPLTLSTPSPSTSAAPPQLVTSQLAGAWSVASGSVAGYRVREQLAFLSAASDAVGRTSSITGSATVTGGAGALSVTAASFSVDVSSLTSDRSMRDDRIHSIGLQSDTYPTATFVLTAPIQLPSTAAGGAAFRVDAVGRLTIHGTTRTETIPLDARLTGTRIEAAGSITFGWGDFGMEAPSIGGFVSVTDQATMEFDLHLQRA